MFNPSIQHTGKLLWFEATSWTTVWDFSRTFPAAVFKLLFLHTCLTSDPCVSTRALVMYSNPLKKPAKSDLRAMSASLDRYSIYSKYM